MAQITGSLNIREPGLLIIGTLLTPVSAVRAQVGEPASDRPENPEQPTAENANRQ